MKRRKTVYICDHCGAVDLEQTVFFFGHCFKTFPKDWSQLGKEHLCPKCSKIYSKFKQEVEKENENK